jgi:hypothetical protein
MFSEREHQAAMTLIAQAVINIDCGLETVKHGSPVYWAMVTLIREENSRLGAS